jgi:hypothetical protein
MPSPSLFVCCSFVTVPPPAEVPPRDSARAHVPTRVLSWDSARVRRFFVDSGLSETIADALLPEVSNGTDLDHIASEMCDGDIEAIAVKCTTRTVDKSRVVRVLRRTDWTTVSLE